VFALVRHGQTDWNVAGRIQGSSDVPLNDTGRAQARDAGRRLAASGIPWELVVSSPLARAAETADLIAEQLGLPRAAHRPEWREQDYGIGEGMIAEELWAAWPQWDQPGKEHDDDVIARGLGAIEQLRAEFGTRHVVVVAHGNIIRYPLNRILGRTLPDLPNAAVAMLDHDGGAWRVELTTI
jgi:probable phosphoglycerate mutase